MYNRCKKRHIFKKVNRIYRNKKIRGKLGSTEYYIKN